jgi:PKD repeat protein
MKLLKFKTLVLALLLTLGAATHALASGKMEVPLNQKVNITADSRKTSAIFKWTLKRGNEIVNSQTNRLFSYIFGEAGEYTLNLIATSPSNQIENTSIDLLVGDRFPRPTLVNLSTESELYLQDGTKITVTSEGKLQSMTGETYVISAAGQILNASGNPLPLDKKSRAILLDGTLLTVDDNGALKSSDGNIITELIQAPLAIGLTTVPSLSSDGRLHLIGDSKVAFDLSGSTGDILEYRIDRNIYADSDKNGTANDDVDNASDTSYLTGGLYETDYRQSEGTKLAAEITLVSKDGKRAKKQVEILFDTPPVVSGDPVARLDASPAPSAEDRYVHLTGDSAKVAFYARKSTGVIKEYRIDKNIFFDSNGDGNPGNDIDNLNDISFRTGDVWVADYEKTDAQIIAQLIAVGEGGKGSRVQIGLKFGEKPAPVTSVTSTKPVIQLKADKALVKKGDPVKFEVLGLQQALENYTFEWDLNGDGTIDKTTEGEAVLEEIYETPGTYKVSVKITDQDGNAGTRTLEVVVKDAQATIADFEPVIDGNTVKFTDKSSAASELSDKTLKYQWSFGDPDENSFKKQQNQVGEQNPTYTYLKAGKYLVTLQVTDADSVIDTHNAEIEIAQDAPGVPLGETPAPAETPKGQGTPSVLWNIVKIILKIGLYMFIAALVAVVLLVGGFFVYVKAKHPDLSLDEILEEMKAKFTGEPQMKKPAPVAAAPARSTPVSVPEPEVVEAVPMPDDSKKPEKKDDSDKTPPTPPTPPSVPPAQPQGPVPSWLKNA